MISDGSTPTIGRAGLPATDGTVFLTRAQRFAQQWRTTTPPDASRNAVWKHVMSHEEQAEFATAAGNLLEELEYEF